METPGSGYTSRSRNRIKAISHGVLTTVTAVPGQKPTISTNRYPVSVVGRQTTESRDNHFNALQKIANSSSSHENSRRAARGLDIGGNFSTIDNWVTGSHFGTHHTVKTGFTTRTYRGPLFPSGTSQILPNTAMWPKIQPPTTDYLFGLGGTAISRCEPTNPNADLAVALAELVREGLPSMAGSALKTFLRDLRDFRNPVGKSRRNITTPRPARAAGEEYLNYQFGIRPIVADVQKFAEAVVNSDSIMRQFDRDSGRNIRRSYHFPSTVETSVISTTVGQAVYPTLPTPMYSTGGFTGKLTVTRKRTVDVWFSGAFRYAVPYAVVNGTTVFQRDVTRARKLLGLRLDAEVLWNLAPWSWFADWFINCGDVIHNAQAFANNELVMAYGYLMYKETIEDTYTHSGVSFLDGPTGEISMTFGTTLKRRVKAHPFGFGFKDDMLSARQLAILASIGITGGRN